MLQFMGSHLVSQEILGPACHIQLNPWLQPCGHSRIPPQLKKKHVVPTSSQDEALARSSISREVPRSVLKCKMIFGTLNATPKVPRRTGRTRNYRPRTPDPSFRAGKGWKSPLLPTLAPTRRVPPRGTPRVPAPLPLSPFSPSLLQRGLAPRSKGKA